MLELSSKRFNVDAAAPGFRFKFRAARMQSIIHGEDSFHEGEAQAEGPRVARPRCRRSEAEALLEDPDIVSAEGRGLCDPDGIALGQRMTIVLEDGSEIPIRVRTVELDRIHFQSDQQQP